MFQNTQNITKTDFARICYASVIGMFGDPEHNIWPTGYTEPPIIMHATCITGSADNKCKVNWFTWYDIKAINGKYGSTISGSSGSWGSKFHSTNIQVGSTYSVTQIDPSLILNAGETKIILEISLYKGKSKKDYDRDYFKLFFARVSEVFSYDKCPVLMNHSIIFTPKPGTFDPNNPP